MHFTEEFSIQCTHNWVHCILKAMLGNRLLKLDTTGVYGCERAIMTYVSKLQAEL